MRLLFLALMFASRVALAGGPVWPVTESPKHWLPDPDSVNLHFDSAFFTTDGNYNDSGEAVTLSTFNNASYWNSRLNGSFPLGLRFSVHGQLAFQTVHNSADASVTQNNNSVSGLSDAYVALRYIISSNRLLGGRFATADRIGAGTMRLLAEAYAQVPFYSEGSAVNPSLGDGSTDLGTKLRFAWFMGEHLAFSFAGGYTSRSDGYASEFPYNLRADYYLIEPSGLRFWAELQGSFSTSSSDGTVTSSNLPGGSALFGSRESSLTHFRTGLAVMAGESWEIGAEFFTTVLGTRAPAGNGAQIGIAFRPVANNMSEFYNPRHDVELGGYARRKEVVGYQYVAPIVAISAQGNYVKINRGVSSNVHIGDRFHIFATGENASRKGRRGYVAAAKVVRVQPETSYLKIDQRFRSVDVKVGYEARRVKYADPEAVELSKP